MDSTKFIAIIGTGRNGTYALSKILNLDVNSEVHHEYNFEPLLKLGFLKHYGLISASDTDKVLRESHFSASFYSQSSKFIDCSNALSWLIPSITSQFSDFKFVDVPRNGRRVVSSFYNKFKDVMYPLEAVKVMDSWLKNQESSIVTPAPHKKYWRILPPISFDQSVSESEVRFERYRFSAICNYWVQTNKLIQSETLKLPSSLVHRVKFEELFQPKNFKILADYLEIRVSSEMLDMLNHPINVHEPINYRLTDEQEEVFIDICGETMIDLGYNPQDDYAIKY